jgi:hypothetical protein
MLKTIKNKKLKFFLLFMHKNSFSTIKEQKITVLFNLRWRRRRSILRIENWFFGEPWPLSLNVALFKYASSEDIFFLLSCENEKVDFSKCQLLQQHLLDPSNTPQIQPAPADFSCSF